MFKNIEELCYESHICDFEPCIEFEKCTEEQKKKCWKAYTELKTKWCLSTVKGGGGAAAFGYEKENGEIQVAYVGGEGVRTRLGKFLDTLIKEDVNKYKELIHLAGDNRRFGHLKSYDDFSIYPEQEEHTGEECKDYPIKFPRIFKNQEELIDFMAKAIKLSNFYSTIYTYYLLTKSGDFIFREYLYECNRELKKLGTLETLESDDIYEKYQGYEYGFNWHKFKT